MPVCTRRARRKTIQFDAKKACVNIVSQDMAEIIENRIFDIGAWRIATRAAELEMTAAIRGEHATGSHATGAHAMPKVLHC